MVINRGDRKWHNELSALIAHRKKKKFFLSAYLFFEKKFIFLAHFLA
jgi:hypothetical protein